MQVIALVGQKGGTGKTTMALGLAVAASHAGKAVAVIDIDPQASAANWKDRREAEEPAVVSAQASRLKQTLEAADQAGAELAIIDTAGRKDDSALNAARVSDLVLIPARPNILELETLPAAVDILRLAGSPKAYVVLNGVHPSASKQAEEAKAMIKDTFEIACTPTHICQRSAYADAMATGSTPQELDPDGKAAAEMADLCHFIMEHIG